MKPLNARDLLKNWKQHASEQGIEQPSLQHLIDYMKSVGVRTEVIDDAITKVIPRVKEKARQAAIDKEVAKKHQDKENQMASEKERKRQQYLQDAITLVKKLNKTQRQELARALKYG